MTQPMIKSSVKLVPQSYKLECPQFDGSNFKGWWAKLEQYFEYGDITTNARVRAIMLHLEGKVVG